MTGPSLGLGLSGAGFDYKTERFIWIRILCQPWWANNSNLAVFSNYNYKVVASSSDDMKIKFELRCTTTNLALSNDPKVVSIFHRFDVEVVSKTLPFKSATCKKNIKIVRRQRRAKFQPRQARRGERGGPYHFASPKLLRIWRTFVESAENFGKCTPRQKSYKFGTLWANP